MTRPRPGRRTFLQSALGLPLAAAATPAAAADYASAGEALDAIEREAAGVRARLAALHAALPAARPFLASALGDHERLGRERARLRARLKLPPASSAPPAVETGRSLRALREAQEALVYAHAEGLPALGDAQAVDLVGRHLVAFARQLTVIDLWREAEEERG